MNHRSKHGPAYSPDMFGPDGRLRFFCKGADTGPALKEQKLAREQSASQFAQQMALEQKQFDAAQAIKTPVYAPAAPLTSGNEDVYDAGLAAKRQAKRRFGSAATNLTAMARPVTAFSPLGIGPAVAA